MTALAAARMQAQDGRLVDIPCCLCGTVRTLRITRPNHEVAAHHRPCLQCKTRCNPEADIDDLAVEHLVAGSLVGRTTRAERQAAVAALTARGLSARVIAMRLRVTSRTVVRLRSRVAA